MDMNDLDLTADQMFLDPYPIWDQIRNESPIFWYEPFEAWVFLDYEDVKKAFQDDKNFSAQRTSALMAHLLSKYGVKEEVFKVWIDGTGRWLISMDGEKHLLLKRVLVKTLTPDHISRVMAYAHDLSDKLIDEMLKKKNADLISDYISPLIFKTSAFYVGVPEELHEQYVEWFNSFQPLFAGGDLSFEKALEAQSNFKLLHDDIEKMLIEREKQIQDDFLSHFVRARKDTPIDDEDIIAQASISVAAGYLSTRDTFGPSAHTLLKNPELLKKFKEDPNDNTINELMRYHPSDYYGHRIAKNDMTIKNHQIKKGQTIFLGLAAANRDPKVFPNPHTIDFTRNPNPHLTFAAGPHICPGYHLGKQEIRDALIKLFQRIPTICLHPDIQPKVNRGTFMFAGYSHLPVLL